jgi:hypothetical protein
MRPQDRDSLNPLFAVIPAKAGIHEPAIEIVDKWVPAFAGTTMMAMAI